MMNVITQDPFTLLLYEWSTFLILIIVGALARIFYNYDQNKQKITFFKILRILVYSIFVGFLTKMILKSYNKEAWEIWLLPITSFTSEVIITTYSDNIKTISKNILFAIGEAITNKIKNKGNDKNHRETY